MSITHVFDTHLHNDYVSGGLVLAGRLERSGPRLQHAGAGQPLAQGMDEQALAGADVGGDGADTCRFLATMRAGCGPILLPPCCHEVQKGLTASGDQAPDLLLLVAEAGFEPATSGL
jgi:hypothetical protein